MLIKEYRIPLPLSLDEYRIAQLYMIQKKSREESEGQDSAVEILENRPYTDGPHGSGQYTYKIFYIGRHLPNWFRNIAPKTALEVHEESWNAYPYTRTKFSVPYVEKFSLEVETFFVADNGCQGNIFKLKGSELRQREVDVIDIVKDTLSGSDYKEEEDPHCYVSVKTNRGPLADDWIQCPPNGVIMCAYKMIKVEFRYWGLQSKVERFIHDYGLRRVMLRAHRQAWAWQDEWVELTMDDIRRLERETQLILQKKLGRHVEEEKEEEEEEEEEDGRKEEEGVMNISSNHTPPDLAPAHTSPSSPSPSSPPSLPVPNTRPLTKVASESHTGRRPQSGHTYCRRPAMRRMWSLPGGLKRREGPGGERGRELAVSGSACSTHWLRSEVGHGWKHSCPTSVGEQESDTESMYSARPEWALDSIAIGSDSDSELEFFDARDSVVDLELRHGVMLSVGNMEEEEEEEEEGEGEGEEEEEEVGGGEQMRESADQFLQGASSDEEEGPPFPLADPTNSAGPAVCDFLLLVLQGGAQVSSDSNIGHTIDYQTFAQNMATIMQLHFHSAVGRLAVRQVTCPNLTSTAFQTLCNISPVPVSLNSLMVDPFPVTSLHCPPSSSSPQPPLSSSSSSSSSPTYLPLSAMPLLTTQSPGYTKMLREVSVSANQVFQQFIQSPDGAGFAGQVCLVTDCMGSVVAYDILTSTPSHPHPVSPSPSSHSPTPPTAWKANKSPSATHSPSPSPLPGSTPHTTSSTSLPPHIYIKSFSESPDATLSCSLTASHKKRVFSSSASSLCTLSLHPHLLPPQPSIGFDFDVTHLFSLGSSLGLVLASRQMQLSSSGSAVTSPPPPGSAVFYNLYYCLDPLASRIEPLLDPRFSRLAPVPLPVYRLHPKGLSKPSTLQETVKLYPYLFETQTREGEGGGGEAGRRKRTLREKSVSTACVVNLESVASDYMAGASDHMTDVKPFSVWWSSHRLDYLLAAPLPAWGDVLPPTAVSHIVHSSYWSAKEVVSFILRQILHHDSAAIVRQVGGREVVPFLPPDSVVKWWRKRTAMKIQRLSPNHRANDVLAVNEGPLPTISAKFLYGPLDMVSLVKEEVDVFVLVHKSKQSSWQHLAMVMTDKQGRLSYTLGEEGRLAAGLHQFKFLVRGDHTTAGCNVFVVPPHTQAVVLSVDGALVANLSLRARDMKCKPFAVDLARYWKDLGFLLVYLSGRPDMQRECIMTFLAANAFPLGLVACSKTISTDHHSKTVYLAKLIRETKVIIQAAYGSQRHLSVYKELGMQRDQIFINGKRNMKRPSEDCLYLSGYQEHLNELASRVQRPAVFDIYSLLGHDTCFALPGKQRAESKRRSRDTVSVKSLSPKLTRAPLPRTDHFGRKKETSV